MTAYYNEIDKFAAQWLRELIKAGVIAPGYVDERSIEDVTPCDLKGFTQCHFFAGIGAWSYALRLAGWPDNRPVWTGSCPCQPFSSAGKGAGFNDERHLWPAFAWLIKQHGPAEIFGEQVASGAANPWFDLVQTDLENMGYAFGCVPFPAAGIGAPHIRDRAYWVAHTSGARSSQFSRQWQQSERFTAIGTTLRLADTEGGRSAQRETGAGRQARDECVGFDCGMGNSTDNGASEKRLQPKREQRLYPANRCGLGNEGDKERQAGTPYASAASPTNGFWSDADWLFCRDGKWRPVEPGTFPLVNGAPARVGRLRGYGNAIVAEEAAQFIKEYLAGAEA